MHLAQLNIATAKYPLDAPQIKDFVDNLEPINQLAEASDGFIWRLQDDNGDATAIQAFDDPNTIVNMSVWQSLDALKYFMFKTHHRDFLRRKSEWFITAEQATYVLWYVPKDHQPSLEEAKERLMYLRQHGESPYAFSFKSTYLPEQVG